jgi:hypothetical protein
VLAGAAGLTSSEKPPARLAACRDGLSLGEGSMTKGGFQGGEWARGGVKGVALLTTCCTRHPLAPCASYVLSATAAIESDSPVPDATHSDIQINQKAYDRQPS